jgi:rubredoxin
MTDFYKIVWVCKNCGAQYDVSPPHCGNCGNIHFYRTLKDDD